MNAIDVVGVSFRKAGKIYYYAKNGVSAERGDFVVIETDKGEDIGVVILPEPISAPGETKDTKNILRIADKTDLTSLKKNKNDELKAFRICKKIVAEHGLEMKLLKAEYTLDRVKLTFYFCSDGRVDFRMLVKELARVFKTRIEMRQVGTRDATKMLNGLGVCGREFCCSSFLRRFDNISIKMAKDQNLLINPMKISGVCGRLMCCLIYEKELYDNKTKDQDKDEYTQANDPMDDTDGGII